MRIVAGAFRGRNINPPPDNRVRPTSDRTREAVFNILEHGFRRSDGQSRLRQAVVADLFAGTGALGLEALSRGAARAIFVEKDPAVIAVLRKNIALMDCAARCLILTRDASALGQAPAACDIVFMDPPYGKGLISPCLRNLTSGGWLRPDGLIVIERGGDDRYDFPAGLSLQRSARYGKAAIDFLEVMSRI